MDELDRLLADTMRDAAGHAPTDNGLLGTVHRRSRRLRRRRTATVAGVSLAVVAVAAGVPLLGGEPEQLPAAGGVQLAAGWTAPEFPYTLPKTEGMSDPIATSENGQLSAFFEATELENHADVTVTVSDDEPGSTAKATKATKRVRGHSATLWTVNVKPAKQLTLIWQESAGEWIELATDDTYTPAQVVAIADSLTGASIAVQPPFDLAVSPAGLETDTANASRMTFRAPGAATDGFRTVLRKRQQLTGIDRKVGKYDAALTRRPDGVTLSVDVTDWDATLEITVDAGLTITDADLVRYAAGVKILNRSNPE
ncbi:hypothetical protein [Actinoplanes couchii]|uniref:MucB/RseB N-terminal domain-containing protein n=1 Tax=Actinoplanes couchii TaxID=403638 RepID=A0ABQ3WZT0_9ACTN|nr:hypothetical protein [Actinoplanes couchii]MDR6316087.1 hypothetical protein [Actinoplanes couchii]GID51701.1 hypothetical protein Aco03nite_001050 [Actinoplanes couchii]